MSKPASLADCSVSLLDRIAGTERRIFRQEELLAKLARDGHDTAEGEKLLRELWKTHALLHERWRFTNDRCGDVP